MSHFSFTRSSYDRCALEKKMKKVQLHSNG